MDIIENQRTSGLVNAHLTTGPGIYFNAFIHVYSPRAGADNSLGTTESLYHFAHLLQVLKQSLWSMILNEFIHVYSPRAGTDNPLGTKFWCQQKFLITLPICCQFKKISLKSDSLPLFMCVFFSNVYSPRQGQTTHWGQKFYDNRKAFSLCPYVACFKMISSKSDFIHIF